MRRMARDASFDLHRRVLEHKRTALFDMALDTGLPPGLPQRGPVRSAMCVVTVGALHRAFRDAVVRRQRKLRLDIRVAPEAELRLRFLQETAVKPAFLFFDLRHGEESRLCGSRIGMPLHL